MYKIKYHAIHMYVCTITMYVQVSNAVNVMQLFYKLKKGRQHQTDINIECKKFRFHFIDA